MQSGLKEKSVRGCEKRSLSKRGGQSYKPRKYQQNATALQHVLLHPAPQVRANPL
jgi:hypothetical protein